MKLTSVEGHVLSDNSTLILRRCNCDALTYCVWFKMAGSIHKVSAALHRHFKQPATTLYRAQFHGQSSSPLCTLSHSLMPSQPVELWISHTPMRTMAGHNKWSNIRHIKAAKDAQKSSVSAASVRKIRVAAIEGAETNPKYNPRLASAIDEAQKNDVPNATIKAALDRLQKNRDTGQPGVIEGRGLGNSALIISTLTDKPKHTRSEIQSVLKKFGGSIGNSGSSQHFFDFKGVILAGAREGCLMSLDDATEVAIEVGAEEVDEATNDSGDAVLQFICEPKDLHAVTKRLKEQQIEIKSSRHEYIPNILVRMDDQGLLKAGTMLDKLEEFDFVVNVFHNISILEES